MDKKGQFGQGMKVLFIIIILAIVTIMIIYIAVHFVIPAIEDMDLARSSTQNCLTGTVCHCPVAARYCNGTSGETLPTLGQGESWRQTYPPLGSWSDCADRCFRRCPPAGC